MKRRTRILAGTLTLLAMTFALAETVVASACAPAMIMQENAGSVTQGEPADDCVLDGLHERRDHEDGGEGERHCPFGPAAAAQGCAAVASLPARAAVAPAPSLGTAVAVFVERAQRDLLLGGALFHPPRA